MHFVSGQRKFMVNKQMIVEVAYAKPDKQVIMTIEAELGDSIETVILKSGILIHFPEIDLSQQAVGIFSELKQLTDKVQAGDRVEIYRPLSIDPKEAWRQRVSNDS